MKLGIKDSKQGLLLKYYVCLQMHIQDKMEFLDISLLSTAYWYVAKIE